MSHLRVMGCLAYAHNKNMKGDKFSSCSRKCILLGYPSGTKGWKLFDLEQEVAFISRDVAFQEDIFPYQNDSTTQPAEIDAPEITSPSTTTDLEDSAEILQNFGSIPSTEMPEISDPTESETEVATSETETEVPAI